MIISCPAMTAAASREVSDPQMTPVIPRVVARYKSRGTAGHYELMDTGRCWYVSGTWYWQMDENP